MMSKAPIAHTLRQMRAASGSYSELSHGEDHAQPGSSAGDHTAHGHHESGDDGHQQQHKAKQNEQHTKLKSAPRSDIEFHSVNKDGQETDNTKQNSVPPAKKPTKEVKIEFPSLSPPSVDLTGREVIFAIAVFFFLSLSVGLVVVLVDSRIKELNKARREQESAAAAALAQPSRPPREHCISVDCLKASVQIMEAMNPMVPPCTDFYEYACGGWMQSANIPVNRHYTSTTKEMEATIRSRLRRLLEEDKEDSSLFKGSNLVSAEDKAKLLFNRCIDVDEIEAHGIHPFKDIVDSMGGWAIMDDWNIGEKSGLWNMQKVLRTLSFSYLVQPLFSVGVDVTSKTIQLNLPDELPLTVDQYLSNGTALEAYTHYMSTVAQLYGADHNATQHFVYKTVQFESELAVLAADYKAADYMASFFDMGQEDTEVTLKELEKVAPRIHWVPYLKGGFGDNVTQDTLVSVPDLSFFANLSDLLHRTDERVLNYVLIWRFFDDMAAPVLSESFRKPKMDFDREVKGIKKMSRMQFCLKSVNEWLGQAVGSMYIRNFFPEEHKQDIEDIAVHVKNSFKRILSRVVWMDEVSKYNVIAKLDKLEISVGYPEWLTDVAAVDHYYESFIVNSNMNYFQVIAHGHQHEISKIAASYHNHGPSQEWFWLPQEVGARYFPTKNQVVFPAGLLQVPFYHVNNPRYINYATIGSIIGHEMTHSFDGQGGLFGPEGEMAPVYTNHSQMHFDQLRECLVDYYETIQLEIPDSNETWGVNGMQTLDENFADISGLHVAFEAFLHWENKQALQEDLLTGFDNPNQTFFLSFAQMWCTKIAGDEKNSMYGGYGKMPHSPAEIRVRGTLAQIPRFSKAFGCQRGSPMRPRKLCPNVWKQRQPLVTPDSGEEGEE